MNLFSVSTNLSGDVCSTLFGSASILTLSESDVWFSAVLSVIVIFLFVIFYNRIFSVTFDENFAVATGIHAGAYNLFISVTIAVIIVAAMNLVGSLLDVYKRQGSLLQRRGNRFITTPNILLVIAKIL